MSLTITNAGQGSNVIAASSAMIVAVTASVGDMLEVEIGASNSGTAGASCISGVTDSAGNTYAQQSIVNRDPGAVNEGTTLGIYTSVLTSALVAGTITVSYSPNSLLSCCQARRIQPSAGNSVEIVSVGAGANGDSATPTITTSSITSGDTVIAVVAAECDEVPTGDADTSNGGAWSTLYGLMVDLGADNDSQNLGSQYKTVTAGTQTFNPTWGGSRDYAINYIVVREVAVGGVSRLVNGGLINASQWSLVQ